MANRFIMFHGLPGAGKTTQAKKLSHLLQSEHAVRINADDIRDQYIQHALTIRKIDPNWDLFQTVRNRTLTYLNHGHTVINEDNNLLNCLYEEFREALEPHAVTVDHVFVEVPVAIAITRNEKRRLMGGCAIPLYALQNFVKHGGIDENGVIDRSRFLRAGDGVLDLTELGLEI